MRPIIFLALAALLAGCIAPEEPQEVSSTTTAAAAVKQTTTTAQAASTSTSTATLPATEANRTLLCSEARENVSVYKRCKLAGGGKLSLPPSERKRCAQIQAHAGEFLRSAYHALSSCVGIPADGLAMPAESQSNFCSDLSDDSRDECYFAVRQCGRILDKTLRARCEAGSVLD